MKEKLFRYIDLYAGCGGLSLGLTRSGWEGHFAIEKDSFAFATLQHNLIEKKKHFQWPSWLPLGPHDIDEVLLNYKAELRKMASSVEMVVGGPPCQGFSVNGKRKENDRRNKLVNSYVTFIELLKPRLLFFENVRGFTMEFAKNGSGAIYSNRVTSKLEELGYDVHAEILNFADYGVPQRRRRFILVGCLNGKARDFFTRLHEQRASFLKNKKLPENVSVSFAISDLEKKHGDTNCPDSKNFRSGLYAWPQNNYQKLMRANCEFKIPDSHRFPKHRQEIIDRFEEILETAIRNKQLSGELRSKYDLRKRSITPLDGNFVCPTITSLPDDYIHYAELTSIFNIQPDAWIWDVIFLNILPAM